MSIWVAEEEIIHISRSPNIKQISIAYTDFGCEGSREEMKEKRTKTDSHSSFSKITDLFSISTAHSGLAWGAGKSVIPIVLPQLEQQELQTREKEQDKDGRTGVGMVGSRENQSKRGSPSLKRCPNASC